MKNLAYGLLVGALWFSAGCSEHTPPEPAARTAPVEAATAPPPERAEAEPPPWAVRPGPPMEIDYAEATRAQMRSKLEELSGALDRKREAIPETAGGEADALRREIAMHKGQLERAMSQILGASEEDWAGARAKASVVLLDAESLVRRLNGDPPPAPSAPTGP